MTPTGGEYKYRPAWWLPGGHLQTLWGKFAPKAEVPATTVERLATPDGDHIQLHTVGRPDATRRLLLLHGLEGSINSHYVRRTLALAAARDWGATLMVFRGCGSTPNTARRFYHSGETSDLGFVFRTLRDRWPTPEWHCMGVSLGGNVLLKWFGEIGGAVGIRRAAAISVPFDLAAGARHISHGFAHLYDRNFLRTLRDKARAKLTRYPDLFDAAALERARSVFEFDDAVTAPVHGFANADDYYSRSSSIGFLARIRVPTLLLSAEDDPFLPRHVLTSVASEARANRALHLELHTRGGHAGFVTGSVPGRPRYYAERRVFEFFDERVDTSHPWG